MARDACEAFAQAHGGALYGARKEAVCGFETAAEIALPALRRALAKGKTPNDAGVEALLALLCGAELVVCDGNLSARAVSRLTQVCTRPLYVDPVSTAWARELKPFIGRFDTVKPNRMELAALTDCPVETMPQIEAACDVLLAQGVRRVFVSMGADGMLCKGPEGMIYERSLPFDGMVNATGAGDAAMAGIIHATLRGLDVRQTVQWAMGAGMVAIASPDTISRSMSPAAIETMIKEYLP